MGNNYQVDQAGRFTGVLVCPKSFIIPVNAKIIPDSPDTNLGYFSECSKTVESISAEESCQLTHIGTYAFTKFDQLQSLDLSNCLYLVYLGLHCFSSCTKLSSLKLNDNLQILSGASFRFCPLLMTFVIKPSLSFINGESFFATNVSFSIEGENQYFAIYENNVYNKNLSTLIAVSFNTKDLCLPKETTTLGYCCFSSSSLVTINIPESVKTFQSYSFHYSRFLQQLTIRAPITEVNQSTFHNLPELISLWLPDSLTNIKAPFLNVCPKLQAIRFSSSLQSVDPNSVLSSPSIKYIYNLNSHTRSLLWDSGIPRRALTLFTCAKSNFDSLPLLRIFLFFFI